MGGKESNQTKLADNQDWHNILCFLISSWSLFQVQSYLPLSIINYGISKHYAGSQVSDRCPLGYLLLCCIMILSLTLLQIDSQFDVDEARKCLYWIGEMIGENLEILDTDNKRQMADSFHTVLRDGVLLCK